MKKIIPWAIAIVIAIFVAVAVNKTYNSSEQTISDTLRTVSPDSVSTLVGPPEPPLDSLSSDTIYIVPDTMSTKEFDLP